MAHSIPKHDVYQVYLRSRTGETFAAQTKGMWTVLLFLLVLVGLNWWDYSTTVQEYTIAQPKHGDEVANIIGDKTPIVVEIPVAKDDVEVGLSDLESARRWWWLPDIHCHTEQVTARGLTWVSAEREWVGSIDGEKTVWLVHSRYRRFLPEEAVDPWALTKETTPYIGRVQYIEVVLKPGWCIGVPAHWGYALRGSGLSWTAEQHSPFSFVRQLVTAKTEEDE
jgi:hypothetical protein